MTKDSFKRYIDILHQKSVRKNLIIGGSSFFIGILIVGVIIFSFNRKLNDVHHDFNVKLETAMTLREQQVNRLQAGISQDNIRRWNIISVEKLIVYTQRKKSKKNKLKQEPRNKIATWIVDEATRHDLDVTFVAAVIAQESKFTISAISAMEAHGLMQVIDETGQWLSKELGIVYSDTIRLDPKTSIKMGTWYLRWLLNKYDGNVKLALGHYNGGSYQARGVVLKPQYINHAEYKRSAVDVDIEFRAMRERSKNGDNFTPEEIARYKLLEKIRCAQGLTLETENYVPEILNRQLKFQSMMENASTIELDDDELEKN